jgi:cell division protein FtsI/penicillin-binding protein 2
MMGNGKQHPINKSMAAEIKARAKGWTVYNAESNSLRHYTREELYNKLGTYIPPHQE